MWAVFDWTLTSGDLTPLLILHMTRAESPDFSAVRQNYLPVLTDSISRKSKWVNLIWRDWNMPREVKYSGSNRKPLKSSVHKWHLDLLTLIWTDFHPLTIKRFSSWKAFLFPNSNCISPIYLLEITELALLKLPPKVDPQRWHARNLRD